MRSSTSSAPLQPTPFPAEARHQPAQARLVCTAGAGRPACQGALGQLPGAGANVHRPGPQDPGGRACPHPAGPAAHHGGLPGTPGAEPRGCGPGQLCRGLRGGETSLPRSTVHWGPPMMEALDRERLSAGRGTARMTGGQRPAAPLSPGGLKPSCRRAGMWLGSCAAVCPVPACACAGAMWLDIAHAGPHAEGAGAFSVHQLTMAACSHLQAQRARQLPQLRPSAPS